MRSKLGYALLFLGAFLVIAGLLALTYAPGRLERTPIDANKTTRLSGTATLAGADGQQSFPVLAYSITRADSQKSTSDVAVFDTASCVVRDEGTVDGCVSNDDPQQRLITASTDAFATSRTTALAVNGGSYLPPAAVPHEGLVNKWPFNAEKKTYPFWNGTLGKAVPAEYTRTVTLKGLKCYVYTSTVKDASIEVADGVQGTYDDVTTIYVEPRTGSIQNQTESQQRYLPDGTPVIDLQLAFTPAQLTADADDLKPKITALFVLLTLVPIIGLIGGALCIVAGLVLLLRGPGSTDTGRRRSDVDPAVVPAGT